MNRKQWLVVWLYLAAGCLMTAAWAGMAVKERDWAAALVACLLLTGDIVLLAYRRKVESWVEHGKGGKR